MSPLFEHVLVFVVMSVLVTLFTWIYVSHRRREFRFWLLGWCAITVHFAVPVAGQIFPLPGGLTQWMSVVTLIVAGTFFLLSVSDVFRNPRERVIFVIMIAFAAGIYYTGISRGVNARWFFVGLILASTLSGLYQGVRFYGLHSSYLRLMTGVLLPFSGWAIWQAAHGNPHPGMDFYLFGFFYVTGLAYFRSFHRVTPGVVFTSGSFIVWGLVFPVGNYMVNHHIVGPGADFLWDLPKYFVAFGMILTLFENQAQVATTVAGQYQALFEGNMAGVYVSSFEGILLNCNSAFVKMYGFRSKAEALGTMASAAYINPDERAAFLETLSREGRVLNHECRQLRKDGTPFWILERATVVNGPDGRRVIEGTAIDITERKTAEIALRQSEERFAAIFRESPMACGIVSTEGVFLDINETFLHLLGLPAEKVVGKSAVQLGLWKSQAQREQFYQRLRAEGAVHNLEVDFKDANGRRHAGLYFATLVGIGEKQCIFGMLLDQTDKRELEARFLQAQKMEALGRLAGGVAHDFNNLLGVIGGYAELLDTKLGQHDGYRRYCAKIIETTQRASGLTRQLLTFSRKEVTRPMPLQPDQAFRDLAGILPRLIGEDIELTMKLAASGTVIVDKTHFEQIVFNIVINSRDAMPKGGTLSIETQDIFRPSLLPSGNVAIAQYLEIRITDTGMGMSEETRLHAFEPFYTTKEPGRGTGLGLATVYGIVQQCLGEVTIDSQLGKGTQITIYLPAIGDLHAGDRAGLGEEIKKGSGNILLVEDEPDLRSAGAEFLSTIGYSVICASSGPEALKLAREAGHIDLVISDVVMPKMNGREFADQLLLELPKTKVLFVSGYADNDLLNNGHDAPVPFLQKPFSLRELGTKVSELLSVSRSAKSFES
ncbi:MAG TPA: PAS domain S-box protein [Candidatus Angelobacter sp.]|nr:PAS domain S-box protein [Candidatus Angelobacter sp.]